MDDPRRSRSLVERLISRAFDDSASGGLRQMYRAQAAAVFSLFLLCLFAGTAGAAGHAPFVFYRVSNDAVNTDRFQSPEQAARVSIDRFNARFGNPNIYYIYVGLVAQPLSDPHFGPYMTWQVLYNEYRFGQITGPWGYGSGVGEYFACDLTPRLGPDWASDTIGLPKVETPFKNYFANGCPAPTFDGDKNLGFVCCDGIMAGNPVNTAFGNKYQEEVDIPAKTADDLSFVRSYNSLAMTDQAIAGNALGGQWRHSYERVIVTKTSPTGLTTAFALRPQAKVLKFTLAGGQWSPDEDVDDSLEQLTDGNGQVTGWILTTRSGQQDVYDLSGRLVYIRDHGFVRQTLQYSDGSTPPSIAPAPGLLIRVTHWTGRDLDFAYEPSGRLLSVKDPAGQSFSYQYNSNGILAGVTDPDGRNRAYLYGESVLMQGVPRATHLTGIVSEDGVRYASFGYNTYGEAVSTTHAGGAGSTTVAYRYTNGVITGATVTDALGTAHEYSYSHSVSSARNTSLTVPCAAGCSGAATTGYDARGNVNRTVDFNGNLSCRTFDGVRNLEVSRTEGLSGTTCPGVNVPGVTRTITTTWHPTLRLPDVVTESGRTTDFDYDTAGNVTSKTVTDTATGATRTWSWTYNVAGQVLTEDGPRTDVTDVTTYTYYNCTTGGRCGQVATVTNAAGHVTTYNTYNARGQPLTLTDPNGVVTALTYDARQRLTSRTVGTESTTFDYWPTGRLRKVALPDGSYLTYSYDSAQRLTRIDDSALNYVVYTLDAVGNRTSESVHDSSGALSRSHSWVFNSLNRLWKDVNAAGTPAVTTTFGYDVNGNQTSVGAPLGRNTANMYDAVNRLTRVTDPAAGNTSFGYDTVDNLTSVTDPRNLQTVYQYDGFGDLRQLSSPDTGVTGYTYDAAGNLKNRTDARGKTGTYGYDALNRVLSISYPDRTVSFGYDAGTNGTGRLTGASDANHVLAWSYDAQGRVTGTSQRVGTVTRAVGYGYVNGQLRTINTPSGQTVGYSYDGAGRVAGVTVNGTVLLSNVLYDPFGPPRSWQWGNGTYSNRTYDQDGKLTSYDSAGFVNYGYDDALRITSRTDTAVGGQAWSYGYDALDRLTSGTRTGLTRRWTYDANGNRLTQAGTNSATYTISPTSNRIASIIGTPARTYGYDAVGNTTGYGTVTLTYQDDGRLKIGQNGATTRTYVYNALGQRAAKKNGTSFTRFMYDEAGRLIGEYNNAGTLVNETVWLGDSPVAVLTPKAGGGVDVWYIHSDVLNTPRKITRPSDSALRWRWDPDPFGTNQPNQNPAGLGTFSYNLRFPGQYYDSETGLSYNYFRDYDPQVGRYVESDPIGQRFYFALSLLREGASRKRGYWNHLYAYADSNPVLLRDPKGLGPLDWLLELFSDKAPEEAISKAVGAGLATLCIQRNCGRERGPVELYGDCASFLSQWIKKNGPEVAGLIGGITGDGGQAVIAECAELCAKGIKTDSCRCKGPGQ